MSIASKRLELMNMQPMPVYTIAWSGMGHPEATPDDLQVVRATTEHRITEQHGHPMLKLEVKSEMVYEHVEQLRNWLSDWLGHYRSVNDVWPDATAAERAIADGNA